MGSGRFDPGAYNAFTTRSAGKSTDEIYASRHLNKALDPKGVKLRESRDSADNPNSTPLIVGLDVTGSMNILADTIARTGLGTLFTGVLDRKPISDPHVMFMGIGDALYDQAPLQVSQFEADKRIIEQLTLLYLEHGGGGNDVESYQLPWYFAAFHTSHDSIEKRGKRGYLFTVGDEEPPAVLTAGEVEKVLGYRPERDYTSRELLELAQRSYDVFHIVIEEGDHARRFLGRVIDKWQALLGQHVIRLKDHLCLAETIVSAIEVAEGRDAELSAKGWGDRAALVWDAVRRVPSGGGPKLLGGGSGASV